MNKETKTCQNCRQSFIVEPEDFTFYEKMQVPAPTFCPDCRLQRRLAWRNERSLYARKCGKCGKDTISMYHAQSKIPMYCNPCWWGDNWSSLDYGQDYDFSRPFFVQFRELMEKVPHANLSVSYKTLVNSDYNNMNHMLKNCYLLFNSDYDEDCMYGEEVESCKDCIDITMADHSEFLYQTVNCNKCNRVFFSQDCEGCHDVWFSKNLNNCSDCFGCVNLKNKQHHIFNRPYSKQEYDKKLAEYNTGSYESIEKLKKEFENFKLKFPYKYMHGKNNTNVSGDYIYHSKNVTNSFIMTESENCRYTMWMIVKPNKDCYDFTQFGENTQQVYESLVCGKNIQNIIGGINIIESLGIKYSAYCYNNTANSFGCIGLRSKKYCILNKQYTQDKYEEILPKIIKHMEDMPYIDDKGRKYVYGDFFPAQLSHFGYNETSAYEYFPITANKAKESGFSWYESEKKERQTTITAQNLSDTIQDVNKSIIKEVIKCLHKGECEDQCPGVFRILPAELKFYQKNTLPLPKLCSNCRHYERLKERNPLKLWHGKCQCNAKTSDNGVFKNTLEHFHKQDHCPNEFKTSYALDRQEIIYCDACYLSEVA